MGHIENVLANLLKEQHAKKAELDHHIQLNYLGLDNDYHKIIQRYNYMKDLAARIIEIENLLDNWANCVLLPQLAIGGIRESVSN